MLRFFPATFALAITLVGAAGASAQTENGVDRPQLHVPLRQPTKAEIDKLEALYLFAEGVLCEHDSRLLEAAGFYEKAAQLDPNAVSIHKALLLIYIATEHQEGAAALLEKVLQLDPHDYEMSYLFARLLRNRGKLDQACEVLTKGLRSKALQDRPDMHQQMEYDLGILYEHLVRYDDAAAAFDRAAFVLDHQDERLESWFSPEEIQLRSAEVHERAGRNYLDARQYDNAAAAFRQAQSKYPAGANRVHYYLAQVNLRQGKLEEAATALNSYLKTLPQDTDAYELMIGILQKLKRDPQIVPWLEEASARDTFNVGLRLLLARQCVRAGQLDKAEKIYQAMAESAPTEQIYSDWFLVYKNRIPGGGEEIAMMLDAAFQAATRKDNVVGNDGAKAKAMIAALRANNDVAHMVLAEAAISPAHENFHIDTLQIFAAIADRLEMMPEAELFYRQCIRQQLPAATEPLVYGGLLRVLWKVRHYDEIIDTCRTGLTQTQASNRVLLRADMSRALAQLDRWPEAVNEVDQAVRDAKEGERFMLQRLQVSILTRAGKAQEAEAECLALLKDHALPGEVLEIRYLLANVYSALNRPAESEAQLVDCLKIDSDSISVNNDLGFLWADQNKNLAEAEAMIRKGIELDRKSRKIFLPPQPDTDKDFKDNACYIDSLGWVLFRRGQLDAGLKELEYATTLPDGDDPVIWDHLGDVRAALGQPAKAVAAWKQALHYYEQAKPHKMDERWRALREKVKGARDNNVKEAPCQAILTGPQSSTRKVLSTPSVESSGVN